MGLFSFLRNAGHKADDDDKQEKKPTVTAEEYKAAVEKRREAAFRDLLTKNGFGYPGLALEINDDTIVLTGAVPSEEAREKIVLLVGNVQGIAKVDDRMSVTGAATPTAAPAEATAAAPGVVHASGPASTAQIGAAGSTFYTVEKGDSLSKIAKHFYGNANRYPEIFEANKPMLSDPDKIYPGQVLRIPGAAAGAGGARA